MIATILYCTILLLEVYMYSFSPIIYHREEWIGCCSITNNTYIAIVEEVYRIIQKDKSNNIEAIYRYLLYIVLETDR